MTHAQDGPRSLMMPFCYVVRQILGCTYLRNSAEGGAVASQAQQCPAPAPDLSNLDHVQHVLL